MKLISVEDQIIKATISALLIVGYTLSVNDGEETPVSQNTNPDLIFTAMKTTDEDYLLVSDWGKASHIGWVRFIYGNDDIEVINDYTVNLEPIMVKIMEMIDAYERKVDQPPECYADCDDSHRPYTH